MSTEPKIEKGIPIPERSKYNVVRKLGKGDSVFFEFQGEPVAFPAFINSTRVGVYQEATKNGIKVTSSISRKPEGVRVWRTK